MIFGVLLLLAVAVVWLVAPQLMPRALQELVAPSGVVAAAIPTPMPLASLGEAGEGETAAQLLSSSINPYTAYPDYFVAASDAAVGSTAGIPRRIAIPAIDLDAPVSAVSLERIGAGSSAYYQWDVPQRFEAGWHNTSARLGEAGNTVINGHHNVHGEVFRDLVDLEAGDKILVTDAAQTHTYRVEAVEIMPERGEPFSVRLENSRWIEHTDDERLTLVTCWPYTGNSHRLVVVALPAD